MKKSQICLAILSVFGSMSALPTALASSLHSEELTCSREGDACFGYLNGTYDHLDADFRFSGDPEGIHMDGSFGERSVTVTGSTRLKILGGGNAYGIRLASYRDQPVHGTFRDLAVDIEANVPDLMASGKKPYGNGIGLWVYALQDNAAASSAEVTGNTDIHVGSKFSAKGIVAGSDIDANSRGSGIVTLHGDNRISIDLEGTSLRGGVTYQAKGIGMLAYDKGRITALGNTDIRINSSLLTPYAEGSGSNNFTAGVMADKDSAIRLNALNITINETSDSGYNFSYGIYENPFGSQVNKKSDISIDGRTNILLLANDRSLTYGIRASGGSTLAANDQVSILLSPENSRDGSVYSFTGVQADKGYGSGPSALLPAVRFSNGLSVRVADSINAGSDRILALKATGTNGSTGSGSSILVETGDGVVQLEGNVRAQASGFIGMNLEGASSYLKGWTDCGSESPGTIRLSLRDGASWQVLSRSDRTGAVTGNLSTISSIELDGGVLDMGYATRGMHTFDYGGTGQRIRTESLSGNGGTIRMDIDLANEGSEATGLNLDQIVVRGRATGIHALRVDLAGNIDGLSPEKMHSDNWLISQESGDMALISHVSGNGMMAVWHATFLPEGDDAGLLDDEAYRENMDIRSDGAGHWYLVRSDASSHAPSSVSHEDVPEEALEQLDMATANGQALSFGTEMEDLRRRLGEVRYGSQDGGWVRVSSRKTSVRGVADGRYTERTNAVHVGFDHLTGASEESAWLLGGAVWYGRSEATGHGDIEGTDGRLTSLTGKLYATYMRDSGVYADLVVQAGRYHQTISGTANDGVSRWNASFRNNGFGVSLETGHMLTLSQPREADDRLWYSHWFVEPQLQASWFHSNGADYRTSTNMHVYQGDADSLMLRAGTQVGRKWSFGSLDDLDRRYVQLMLDGGIKYECLGSQSIRFTGTDRVSHAFDSADLGGVRYYYGASADWQTGDRLRVYGRIGREESHDYVRDYEVTLGLRWTF